jgi:predicted PhzF superfamily epimerase YddE/YHI9
MKIPCFHVDAFASGLFTGNPAAVCPLESWLAESTLQNIAAENNLSETAFTVVRGDEFELRWFTPVREIDLCGHATLAAAFVWFSIYGREDRILRFHSRSGILTVSRQDGLLTLDFPARPALDCAVPEALIEGLGARPLAVLKSRDYMAVFATAAQVSALKPDFNRLRTLDCFGVIATAPGGGDCDFVSRFFAPGAGIDEDPVTGSSHCTLIPYWAGRFAKPKLLARQISRRGGWLSCELAGDRVGIGGKAVLYLRGEIEIVDPGKSDLI